MIRGAVYPFMSALISQHPLKFTVFFESKTKATNIKTQTKERNETKKKQKQKTKKRQKKKQQPLRGVALLQDCGNFLAVRPQRILQFYWLKVP